MADKIDFYLGQLVTEADLDLVQADRDYADRLIVRDQGFRGILSGWGVSEHAGVPDLTVDVAGPGVAYDQEGRRVYLPGGVTVNCAVDSNASPTTVALPGNERWVSLFAVYDEISSDLEVDDNGTPVLTRVEESYQIQVVQGAESASGTASRPALLADGLLIADILLEHGDTQIFDAAIESDDDSIATTRFAWAFDLTGSMPAQVRVGTLPDAMQEVLSALNAHIADVGNAHDGTAVDFDAASVPTEYAATAAATNVQEAIDGVVTDLPLEIARQNLDARIAGTAYGANGASGVVMGYTCTAAGGSLLVTVAPGLAYRHIDAQHARELRLTTATNVNLAGLPTVSPRWVAIEINATTGALVTTAGVAAATPVLPAGVAGRIPIAYAYLVAGATEVLTTDLVDCRPLLVSDRDAGTAEVLSGRGGVTLVTTSASPTLLPVSGRWADGTRFSVGTDAPNLSASTAYWQSGQSYAALAGSNGHVYAYLKRPVYPAGYDADVAAVGRTFHHTGTRILGALAGAVRGAILAVGSAAPAATTPLGAPASFAVNEGLWNSASMPEGCYLATLTYIDGAGFHAVSTRGETVYLSPANIAGRREQVSNNGGDTGDLLLDQPLSAAGDELFGSTAGAFLVGAEFDATPSDISQVTLTHGTEVLWQFNRGTGNEVRNAATQFWTPSAELTWSITGTTGAAHQLTLWVSAYQDVILGMR